jgi:hypothetical protein
MRHHPTNGAIIVMLRGLKTNGMAQAVTDLVEQAARCYPHDGSLNARLHGLTETDASPKDFKHTISAATAWLFIGLIQLFSQRRVGG